MEDLKYQSWSLGRQLNALYETLQQICGLRVPSMNINTNRDVRPTLVGQEEEEDDDPAEQMSLEGLRRQEGFLRQQIHDLVAKLPVRRPQDEATEKRSDVVVVAPAAEALRHFLVSNGGETGGWDPRDHGLFLQWRSRFRNNRQTFVSAVCDTVPGKNAAQVEAHEKWYQNLQRLRREQRQELDEWKRRKRLMDEEERKRLAEESQEDPNGDTWVAEWRRQRPNVRQQLERWKEQKKAIEPAVSAEKMETARKKSQAEQRRRMDHQYQKLVAYLWRMEQEAAKMATESADHFLARLARKEKSQSSPNTQLMAEQRQQRDREWLEQRRRQLLTRQQQQPAATKATLRRSVSVPRDPQRLMRPTSAFMARLVPPADDDDAPSPQRRRDSSTSYILDVQSKTVPSWRQLSS